MKAPEVKSSFVFSFLAHFITKPACHFMWQILCMWHMQKKHRQVQIPQPNFFTKHMINMSWQSKPTRLVNVLFPLLKYESSYHNIRQSFPPSSVLFYNVYLMFCTFIQIASILPNIIPNWLQKMKSSFTAGVNRFSSFTPEELVWKLDLFAKVTTLI